VEERMMLKLWCFSPTPTGGLWGPGIRSSCEPYRIVLSMLIDE
jgi:hypothetical protein